MFRVHPEARNGPLGAQILAWAATEMRIIGSQRRLTARITVPARDHETERIALLEDNGFTTTYHELTMARSLHEPIPVAPSPHAISIRSLAGPQEVDAWVLMLNEAYRDIRNPYPVTVATRLQEMADPAYKSELDLIAVRSDGVPVAFCWCAIDDATSGWVRRLGTRLTFRHMGVGRTMLVTGLNRLKACGAEMVYLYVDSDNTAAIQLYQSVGFHRVDSLRHSSKDV